jgi:hypothetical protein
MDEQISDRIGLLFVHGVGEQKRWEHLHASVLEFAELIRRSAGAPSVTIVDRTANWGLPAGTPNLKGEAPISMDVRLPTRRIRFECQEVWWADLGTRSGPLDSLRFWLWGLGQWCAPIYRDMDVSRTAPTSGQGARLTAMPRSVVGKVREVAVRFQLFSAALAAAFVACTWSLAKRLFAFLLGQAPSPTLIVQYVGDIRTFTERAAPGDSALSDPGFPRRVGIRRRMISEMVALAAREDVGEWYVLAHSLGTVVAYNGLTEIGHTLPNYLSEAQWRAVPAGWKVDPITRPRDNEIGKMMPARPHWVEDHEVIDRSQLFARLRGFLTYGSPLDKFSGLWPRIVATATDRTDGRSVFPAQCDWVNLYAPTDPVAGRIDCYAQLAPVLPPIRNCRTRWSILAGLEHITYFKGFERHRKKHAEQRLALVEWLLGAPAGDIPKREQRSGIARFAAWILFAILLLLLWAATTAVVVLARSAWDGSASSGGDRFFDWHGFLRSLCETLGPTLSLFVAPILVVGVYRWARETWLNWRLSKADNLPGKVQSALLWNVWAASAMTLFSLPLLYVGAALELGWPLPAPIADWSRWLLGWVPRGWLVGFLCGLGLFIAMSLQAFFNRSDPKPERLRKAPEAAT